MRMYALYDRDRRILGFLVAVAAASVVVGCWSIISGPSDDIPRRLPAEFPGCNTLLSDSQACCCLERCTCFRYLCIFLDVVEDTQVGRKGASAKHIAAGWGDIFHVRTLPFSPLKETC
ncbi:hypothetical protein HETIRDRAFT_422656 [Heterobasidion irregulare TC 32-1]|uniref:Uncharacterized protein n=1 Tax=Heterobasidion irregulare (strain TC 32-1) TaxID=747525 RepID=W4JT55_HETIT|nr:uncharacterized protein HETIRDRAFT_422656 [Heterobasidion irregulare TC 32-1]ETW76061.1 hypothetical protein HETIRDRAFT_422656 [Heterobasidion irregulare TC 32-1]